MNFIERTKMHAKEKKMKIVLPETMDERVLEAASIALKEELADIILIGNKTEVEKKCPHLDLSKAEFIDPQTSNLTEQYTEQLAELRKNKGMTKEEAKRLLTEDYMYFACMLVYNHQADGVVSGACHSTANTLRPSLQIIKTKPGCELVSAFFLMVVPDCPYGEKGTFIFADS